MDFSYIIVFVILIIGVLIWQLSQSRSRQFTLSKQIFPDLDLLVIIAKKERKIQDVIVRVEAKKELNLLHIRCELISENREFTYIDSSEISESIHLPYRIQKQTGFDAIFPFQGLKEVFADKTSSMNTFRMVVVLEHNKTYKSHELALSKYWKIYKADTGKYN
ncbi:MAG: hypothetical protein DRI88_00485 [Bacteroidetes bacterium]|nr:MAG: hypothetical protein DRI72_07120 [Bacteroidota bacterium]RLD49382.1 MAG: hypothetical protein DRI88_00485 [Bacteroidota bacterium]RLD74668.1 MAG: hypothetical protein DRI87_00240 [Bacteroidota bacterium]RLD87239.1 MAG: hypothetical protein DRJ02_06885 [Bacteroidota bacterium]